MIDIGKKKITDRKAVAEAKVFLKASVIEAIRKKTIPKGDVLEAARLAGILAAKKTSSLLPLCHPIPIDHVTIVISLRKKMLLIQVTVKGQAKTGFEMEALTAASVSALTVYDMCKPLDKEIVISDILLTGKTGGKSGTYVRKA